MKRTKIADRTYMTSSKENVHCNVEEIGELFPLKTARLRTELTNFKGYGTSLSVKPTFFKGTCRWSENVR